MLARSVDDGTERWRYDPDGDFAPVGVAPVPEGSGPIDVERSVVATSRDGRVVGLFGDRAEWTAEVAGPVSPPVVGDAVYVTAGNERVVALDPRDGERLADASTPAGGFPYPLETGVLVVTGGEGRTTLVSLGPDGTERWRFGVNTGPVDVAVEGDRVFLAGEDGTVRALGRE